MRRWFALGIVILNVALWPVVAVSQQTTGDRDVAVEAAWARATAPDSKTAAVYFTLRNMGQSRIDLIGVRADRASIETLHKTVNGAQGTTRMSATAELRVEPGQTVVLEPGSIHVMLLDLETPLIEGKVLPLRLKFYDGDDLTVDVPILAPDAEGPTG